MVRVPIDVYQIGEIYFVKDGNHRISVAREMGRTHIAAFVTEVHSRVAWSTAGRAVLERVDQARLLEELTLHRCALAAQRKTKRRNCRSGTSVG